MQREQIIAFRLNQQYLLKKLPLSDLARAAAIGVQNTVPGTATLSLAARISHLTPDDLVKALQKKKTLVEITGIRGASYIVPSQDFSLFTSAVFPTTEKDLEIFLGSTFKLLKAKNISATKAVETVAAAANKALNGKALTQDEIHEEWRRLLPKNLLSWCRGCNSFHVSYSVVMAVGLKGTFCFGPLKDGVSAYVRTDQWLPAKNLNQDLESTRRQLIERFINFYAPTTPAGFATWAGISKKCAESFWTLLEDELTEVFIDGKTRWVLKKDLPFLRSPPTPKGIILLPPKDAFLNLPDRETLTDKKIIPRVWKILGNPGVIISDGHLVGLWKFQKKQSTLQCQFELIKKISASAKKEVESRAESLAPLRECKTIQVKWSLS